MTTLYGTERGACTSSCMERMALTPRRPSEYSREKLLSICFDGTALTLVVYPTSPVTTSRSPCYFYTVLDDDAFSQGYILGLKHDHTFTGKNTIGIMQKSRLFFEIMCLVLKYRSIIHMRVEDGDLT